MLRLRWMTALLAFVLLASAGCNLAVGVNTPIPPSPTRPGLIIERPTSRAVTHTPAPPTATSVPPTNLPNCSPRTDWVLYTIATGDTLGSIAANTGVTVAVLTEANCLANANMITVGQKLRVPRLPPPPTATPTRVPPTQTATTTPQQFASIMVSPFVEADAGNFAINGGTTVTITWVDGPADAMRVDFYQRDFGGGMIAISTDTNMADGISTTWLAPAGYSGTITALATRASGSTVVPIFTPTVYVNDPYSPTNSISIDPYLRFENTTYFIAADTPVDLTWDSAPRRAARIDFIFTSAQGGESPRLLGSDSDLTNGASLTTQFAAGESGTVSAEAYRSDGTRITFAASINLTVQTPEA